MMKNYSKEFNVWETEHIKPVIQYTAPNHKEVKSIFFSGFLREDKQMGMTLTIEMFNGELRRFDHLPETNDDGSFKHDPVAVLLDMADEFISKIPKPLKAV
jgi:hypothetical protein